MVGQWNSLSRSDPYLELFSYNQITRGSFFTTINNSLKLFISFFLECMGAHFLVSEVDMFFQAQIHYFWWLSTNLGIEWDYLYDGGVFENRVCNVSLGNRFINWRKTIFGWCEKNTARPYQHWLSYHCSSWLTASFSAFSVLDDQKCLYRMLKFYSHEILSLDS